MLTPALLLHAYATGVFPMAEARDGVAIHWVDPTRRTVFPITGLAGSGFHVSRSLARQIRRTSPRVSVDSDFAGVVAACADRPETWINAEIFTVYTELHRLGHAHSVEVWQDDALTGGVYGVAIGAAFFGESMFSRATNGSKTALTYLVHRLRAGGFTLFDVQFMTDHLKSLGAVELPRAEYRRRLTTAIAAKASFTPPGYPPEPDAGFVLAAGGGTDAGAGGGAAPGTSQCSTQTS